MRYVRNVPPNAQLELTIYQTLSDLIVKHYMTAGQTKAGESVLGDLAALRLYVSSPLRAVAY